jgi:hypothetical protein
MTHEDLAFATTYGKKLNLTKSFESALEIQEATDCELNEAKKIVKIASILNEKYGSTIVLSDMKSWASSGIPNIVTSEFNKIKEEVELARKERERIACEKATKELNHFLAKAMKEYGFPFGFPKL